MKTIDVHIRGTAPMLQHNASLVDPTNEFVREIKKLTAKKTKKTDADNIEIARLEFVGGLYTDAKGQPAIPLANLEATIRDGARARRQGKDTLSALYCTAPDGDTATTPLIYDGPRDPDELWASGTKHVHRTSVVINKSRVIRNRPMFPTWEAKFCIQLDDEIMNPADCQEALNVAGQSKGIGDYRPKYGRFEVVSFKVRRGVA